MNAKYFTYLAILLISLFLTSCESQNQFLKLNELFSDHMVLQQNQEVPFWGESAPKSKVGISASWGEEVFVSSDENGAWQIKVKTPEAGGPHQLSISTKDTTIEIKDVFIGEVWLASGQSNMEMPVKGWPPNDPIDNSAEEIANAGYPAIRMITVQRRTSETPLKTFTGSWKVCSLETAADFSATAYFFARRIHKELNVPVGIIHSSWGGTPAESWVSKEQLKTLGDFDTILEHIEAYKKEKGNIDKWRSQFSKVAIQADAPEADWKDLSFEDDGIADPEFDDNEWLDMNLPTTWENAEIGPFDGVVWFRKEINLDNVDSDYELSLGPIDDMDATYFNGKRIGGMEGTGKWNIDRIYSIPKSALKKGKNVLAVRVIDTGGGGGIYGSAPSMHLSTSSGEKIDLSGSWKYRPVAEYYNNEFIVFGLNGAKYADRPKGAINLTGNTPTGLYNGMINPLIPYKIKGAIWYQGESNVGRAEQYRKLFPTMITDWRARWEADFPFYFVQIAPYQYAGDQDPKLDLSQKLRDAQRLTLSLKNTGMVVTMDIGNYTNIHPGNKQDVGARLAAWALAKDYGKDVPFSGPLFKASTAKGNKLELEFDHVGSGLVAKEGGLLGFEIAGVDKNYFPAVANIEGDKVEVFSDKLAAPMYARYAWLNNGVATLFNKEGLPASSFTTED